MTQSPPTQPGSGPSAEMADALGLNEDSQHFVLRHRWAFVIGLVLLIAAVVVFRPGADAQNVTFRTASISRDDLTVTVTATGTIEPLNQVDVGAEISGLIEEVHVDFNDSVGLGAVLATLDKDQLTARVRQSEAQLVSAEAKVEESRANEMEARNNLQRAERLHEQGNVSEQALDNAKAAHARAQAALASSAAQVTVAEANLAADQTNLSKTDITAPIDGIVLTRQVEPGQTVAASFQTPVLFTLAEDLSAMKLVVDIDEADIGQVIKGQAATFAVDAYPGRVFPAEITSVRFAPKNENGVVTYEALLSVDNSDLSLRPGMTATAIITTATRDGALLVPYAALRFTPPMPEGGEAEETARRRGPPGLMGMIMPRFNRNRGARQAPLQPGAPGQVWVLDDGQPRAIIIEVGLLDGERAEIVGSDLQEGQSVIIGTQAAS